MEVRLYFTLLVLLTANIYPARVFSQSCTSNELVNNGGFECASCTNNGAAVTSGLPSSITGSMVYTNYTCPGNGHGVQPNIIAPGQYAIVTSNPYSCYDGFISSGAVRTGTYAALFDGQTASASNLWCQTITGLSSSTTYAYTAYYRTAASGADATPPQIQLTITYGGSTTLGIPATVGTSYAKAGCLTSPPSGITSATICIVMLSNASNAGNDILIDDISFGPQADCPAAAGLASCTTLPINLISFTAKENNNRAALEWITASEQNSSYFSVQKSTDAVNFTEIGTVNARGNSSNQINYEFEDTHLNEASYYRLKMVDKDGTFKYSSLAFLKKDMSVRVISNLDERGELQIRAIVNEDAHWNLAVYSLLGQEYLNEKISLVKGENTILKGISGGEQSAKIIRITGEDGTVILSEVVVW